MKETYTVGELVDKLEILKKDIKVVVSLLALDFDAIKKVPNYDGYIRKEFTFAYSEERNELSIELF